MKLSSLDRGVCEQQPKPPTTPHNPLIDVAWQLIERSMVHEKQSRSSRLVQKKPKQTTGLVITDREQELLIGLFQQGPMLTDQISRWLYQNKTHGTKRLRKLFDHGYLVRQPQKSTNAAGSHSVVHALSKRGIDFVQTMLESESRAAKYIAFISADSTHFQHHVSTVDATISAILSAQKQGFTLTEFKNDALIRATQKLRKGSKIPDVFAVFSRGETKTSFFLETDRGWQNTDMIKQKVKGYDAFSRKPEYWKHYGYPACLNVFDEKDREVIPLLFVVKGQKRLNSLREELSGVSGSESVLLTTISDVIQADFFRDPIWESVSWSSNKTAFQDFWPCKVPAYLA